MIRLLFLLCFLFSLSVAAQTFRKQEAVEIAADDGKVYKATVLDVKEGKYLVHYDGFPSSDDVWLTADHIQKPARIGAAAEMYATDGKWYRGTLLEMANNRFRFRLNGYTATGDQWLAREQFRTLASSQPTPPVPENDTKAASRYAPGTKVEIWWAGKWYAGTIKERRGNEAKVHYEGWDNSWDEWVNESKLRLPRTVADTTANVPKVKGAFYSVGQEVLFSPDRGKSWQRGIVLSVSTDPMITTDGVPVYRIENLKKSLSGYYDVCYITTPERQPSWTSFFVGDWDLYLPMTANERVIGKDVYRVYSGADRLPPLRINADNTYSWAIDKKKIIRGKWQPNANAPGIILLKGDGGTDWYVYSNADGTSNKIFKTDQIRMVSEPHGTPRHGFRIKKK